MSGRLNCVFDLTKQYMELGFDPHQAHDAAVNDFLLVSGAQDSSVRLSSGTPAHTAIRPAAPELGEEGGADANPRERLATRKPFEETVNELQNRFIVSSVAHGVLIRGMALKEDGSLPSGAHSFTLFKLGRRLAAATHARSGHDGRVNWKEATRVLVKKIGNRKVKKRGMKCFRDVLQFVEPGHPLLSTCQPSYQLPCQLQEPEGAACAGANEVEYAPTVNIMPVSNVNATQKENVHVETDGELETPPQPVQASKSKWSGRAIVAPSPGPYVGFSYKL